VGGFAGARTAESLIRRGWKVTGVARSSLGSFAPDLRGRLELIAGDVATLGALPDGLDAIVHAAATRPFVGATSEQLTHDNVAATGRLIELAIRGKVRTFVFFSSTSVFGREHSGVLTDASAPRQVEEYGRSKSLCEQMLAEAASQLASVAIRPPGIIGAGAVGNWVAETAARIVAGKPVNLFNPDALFNNCVHVADLADLVARLIEEGISGHAAAIVCAAGAVEIKDVVDILMRGLRRTTTLHVVKPERTPFTLSCERARRIWDWQPMTVEQSLECFAEEQRAFLQLAQ
jgi:nucleoside-diphosphate-sugar epimerase